MTSTLAPVIGLPEPGSYADPQRNGLAAKDLLDGLIEHLFYSLGRRAQDAERGPAAGGGSVFPSGRLRGLQAGPFPN